MIASLASSYSFSSEPENTSEPIRRIKIVIPKRPQKKQQPVPEQEEQTESVPKNEEVTEIPDQGSSKNIRPTTQDDPLTRLIKERFDMINNRSLYVSPEEWYTKVNSEITKKETEVFKQYRSAGSIVINDLCKKHLKLAILLTSGYNNNCGFNASVSSDNAELFNSNDSRRSQTNKLIDVVKKVQRNPAAANLREWRIFYFVCTALRIFWLYRNQKGDEEKLLRTLGSEKGPSFQKTISEIFEKHSGEEDSYNKILYSIAQTELSRFRRS